MSGKKKDVLYLAGPINGLVDDECTVWREKIKEALGSQFEMLDPMRRDYRGKEDVAYKEIVQGDIQDINDCDVFLANAWKASWGTGMEVFYATSVNKYVVIVCPDKYPSPWLLHHSDVIFRGLDDAITFLRNWEAAKKDAG